MGRENVKEIIFDYHYGMEAEQYAFYRIPKILMNDPRFALVSMEAKLLYGMMLDRLDLSAKNGWRDEEGRVYIYFTIEDICRNFGCGKDKAVKILKELEKEAGLIEEYIPSHIREKYKIAEINYAMKNIHFPEDFEAYNTARRRFVFEELLVLQLALSGRKNKNTALEGIRFTDTDCVKEFISSLPFPLTGAQKRTIGDVVRDCTSGKMMNRLVQGDVGSGKTAVAAAAVYMAVKNGAQAAMMAPTEILAQQHGQTLAEFFEGKGITIVMLTGSMKASEKRRACEMIESGEADVVVGINTSKKETTA